MRRAAGATLTTSAFFLAVVAIFLNSTALFYMSTAILATMGIALLQSFRSVRGLRFERHAPDTVKVGETVKVEITVWSFRRIRRPLVLIEDAIPEHLFYADLSSSLPVAPAYDVPILTQYTFRPLRRGKYNWSSLTVIGTDAMGLSRTEKEYETTPVEMLVLPTPAPCEFEIPPAPAYGISESETGLGRGSGIEPRGVREYTSGDSLRYVHWRSSARAGRLLVKEFATGSYAAISFVFQRTRGTEIGSGAITTLEQICANAAYMADKMLRQGAEIGFPTLGSSISSGNYSDGSQQVLRLLATIEANSDLSVAEEVAQAMKAMPMGGLAYVFLSVADPDLPFMVRRCLDASVQVVAMVYDAEDFLPSKAQLKVKSAGDIDYLARLREAGAKVIPVPKQEGL